MPKFRQGFSSYFWGLKFSQVLFVWVGKFFSYFSGFHKIFAIFGSDKFPAIVWVFQFLYHALESFEWRTHSTEKHKIIVSFHIYSIFDKHCILSHSIFRCLNFGAFYFFGCELRVILFLWVVKICSRTSISVEEMLVCPPPPPGVSPNDFKFGTETCFNFYGLFGNIMQDWAIPFFSIQGVEGNFLNSFLGLKKQEFQGGWHQKSPLGNQFSRKLTPASPSHNHPFGKLVLTP